MKVNTIVIHVVVALGLGCLGRAQASDGDIQSHAKELLRLAHQTKNIWVGQLQTSVESFVPDDDPMSVQYVIVSCRKAANSFVSEDGQVVFLCHGDSDDDERQLLVRESLERRLAILKAAPNKSLERTRAR
jgi:hypothetical protein